MAFLAPVLAPVAVRLAAQVGGLAISSSTTTGEGTSPADIEALGHLKVKSIRIYSCWLGSWPVFCRAMGVVTSALLATNTTHWFVVVETEDPAVWFFLEFGGGTQKDGKTAAGMFKRRSLSSTLDSATACYRGEGTVEDVGLKQVIIAHPQKVTVRDVSAYHKEWNETSWSYNPASNNCQDFGAWLFKRVTGQVLPICLSGNS